MFKEIKLVNLYNNLQDSYYISQTFLQMIFAECYIFEKKNLFSAFIYLRI